MTDTPTSNDSFLDLLKNTIHNTLLDTVNTAMPCEVVEKEGNRVSVKALVMPQEAKYPPVIYHNVPILMPTMKDFRLTYPVKVKDTGLLLTCKLDISRLKKKVGFNTAATLRAFDMNDSVFLPLTFGAEGEETIDDAVQLKYKDCTVLLTEDGRVTLKTKTAEISIVEDDIQVEAAETGKVSVTAKQISLNCETLQATVLKDIIDGLISLLDAQAKGMTGGSTNPTAYNALKPTLEDTFKKLE